MTIAMNVQRLWGNWQRTQRDTVQQQYVRLYLIKIAVGHALSPITIEGLIDEDEIVRIRTADGRHRLTAAYQAGLDTIDADDPPGARHALELFLL